jgi:histone H3-like centromeric protein A
VAALREIRHYQRTTGLLLRRLPFQRLVREVMVGLDGPGNTEKPLRVQAQALYILQEATEAFVVHVMEGKLCYMVLV